MPCQRGRLNEGAADASECALPSRLFPRNCFNAPVSTQAFRRTELLARAPPSRKGRMVAACFFPSALNANRHETLVSQAWPRL
jgi:hypothetical protein